MKSELQPYDRTERTAAVDKSKVTAGRNGIDGAAAAAQIPWQERPVGSHAILWRHAGNPIIGRHHIPGVQGIYNSAVAPYGDGFVGVFRLEKQDRFPHLHLGWSDDGLEWHVEPKAIQFASGDPGQASDYAYDPRVVKIDQTYYITWCGGHIGPTISVAATKDFQRFDRLENAFLPFNRNGVLFPRKIGGKFLMLSRPSDNGHTPFGDIYLSQSPDMCHWGMHRLVMRRGGDQVGHGPHALLDRHLRINPVQIIKVDDIGAQAGQAGIARRRDPRGRAVDLDGCATRASSQPTLGRQHDRLPMRRKYRSNQAFVAPGSIDVGRVEKGDPAGQRQLERPGRLLIIGNAIGLGHPHASQAKGRHAERGTEKAGFHGEALILAGCQLLVVSC